MHFYSFSKPYLSIPFLLTSPWLSRKLPLAPCPRRTDFSPTADLSSCLTLLRIWNGAELISLWPWLECQNIINCWRIKTWRKMYLVHFWHSRWFLNELGRCSPSVTSGRASPRLCVSSQKRGLRVCLNARGRKRELFEVGAVQTQTAHVSLCEIERRMYDPFTLQTPSAGQREVVRMCCMCVCACARVHALVPVRSRGQIQIREHTLSQCSLFSFHRYVNSNVKACIWCIHIVWTKGEES